MRYWTHWHNVKYEAAKRRERMLIWLVWKLPRPVAYWAAIRVGVYATTGKYGDQIVPELLFTDALKRWDYR